MPSLFNQSTRNDIIKRLMCLSIDTPARWGELNASRMLAHLIDACRVSFAEKEVVYKPNFFGTAFGRFIALNLPIPKGIKAPAVFHETEPTDFEEDRLRVKAYIERFAAGPDQRWGVSPLFGPLSPKQWAKLHAVHMNHHLKQFSC